MNFDNLHELINRYEANMEMLYGPEHGELFKWRALKCWQTEWFKPEDAFPSFAARFSAARKEFSLFIDNSRMHPSNGVIKLYEKAPEKIEHLFCNVLFADDCNSISQRQNNMDAFLDGYESLRKEFYPGNWSYKQDRHSASVFLAMNAPEDNFVFKSSEALTMAKYTDFGFSIGAGSTFSLENYYKLCSEIVIALKEHESLLEKHFSYLTEEHFMDKSLHLLAFDLMYCCRTYSFYKGLVAPATGKTIRKTAKNAPDAEELVRQEIERQAKIAELEQEIERLEYGCSEAESISLLDVQVSSASYGIGTVIEQNINMVRVRFDNLEKSFILDAKFSARPRFENDEEIVGVFSEYARAQERIKRLRNLLMSLK